MKPIIRAAVDLRYLLAKGYPRAGALTFVGNHYQLDRTKRELLNRGVYPTAIARARRGRLVNPKEIIGRPLGVDGHNVLITLESAIQGRDLVAADDGCIRDTAGVHASYCANEVTDQAIEFILDFLTRWPPARILFLLDAPMSRSGELASRITAALSERNLTGRAKAVPVPEKDLYYFPGPVATSDSVLIDRTAEPFDLAGYVIRERLPGLKILTLNQ